MTNNNKVFHITFITSLVLHSLIFLPVFKFNIPFKKSEKITSVNYVSVKVPVQVVEQLKNEKPVIKDELRPKQQTAPKRIARKTTRRKESLYRRTLKTIHKMNTAYENIVKQQQKIFTKTGEPLNLKKEKNKTVTAYYKIINEQLQQAVIYPDIFSEGEVALSFVLTSDGNLKSVEVIDETVHNDTALKETAVKIVKNASPFPPFPENLHQQQLTFNVVFCFRERS